MRLAGGDIGPAAWVCKCAMARGSKQISICGSVTDESLSEQILSSGPAILEPALTEMRKRLEIVSNWIGQPFPTARLLGRNSFSGA